MIRSAGSDTYNYDNPVRRDVVSIGSTGDNVTIRFTTDNPGPWIMHWYVTCAPLFHHSENDPSRSHSHIDWHLREGFALVFAEGTRDMISNNVDPVNAAWENLCPTYNALSASQQ